MTRLFYNFIRVVVNMYITYNKAIALPVRDQYKWFLSLAIQIQISWYRLNCFPHHSSYMIEAEVEKNSREKRARERVLLVLCTNQNTSRAQFFSTNTQNIPMQRRRIPENWTTIRSKAQAWDQPVSSRDVGHSIGFENCPDIETHRRN